MAMRGAFIKNTDCTDAHGWVFSRILYSCSAAHCLVLMRSQRNGSQNKHRCHSGCFYQKHGYLSWHAPFSPSRTPLLYVNVVLKQRKPVCIFAPHSFLHYTINTRYDRRQLSYQQRTCVHNAFDDIMEYTIECDDPLETKGIVADIKRR